MKIGIYGCQLDLERIIRYFSVCKDVEIVAVFDEDITIAQAVSLDYNITQYAESIDGLHKDISLDIIYVNASLEKRCQYSQIVINSGFDVLVDYPVSLNTDDLGQLYRISENLNKNIYLLSEFPLKKIRESISKNIEALSPGKLQNVNVKVGLDEYVEQMCSYQKPNEIHWFYQLPGSIFQYYLPIVLGITNVSQEDITDIDLIERSTNILPQSLTDEVLIKLSTKFIPVSMSLSLKESLAKSYIELHYEKSSFSVTLSDGKICYIKEKNPRMLKNTSFLYMHTLINSFLYYFRKIKQYRDQKEIVISDFCSEYDKSDCRLFNIYDKKRMIEDVRLTNLICNKLVNTRLNLDNFIPLRKPGDNLKSCVLVTGGTGLFGMEIVEQLLDAGFLVRVLARKLSNTVKLKDINAEIFYGDVSDLKSVKSAMKDVNYVVHAAADSIGDKRGGELTTILGTSNILEAARDAGVKNIVYISSCSVYEVATQYPGSVLDEDSRIERNPQMRGEYSNAKIVAEKLIQDQMKVPGIQITCLRPGTYFGPGKYMFTPMVGLNVKDKIFLIIKNTKLIMPLVYYKNVASAVVTILDCQLSNNVIYNVIDEGHLNKKQYVEMFLKKIFPQSLFIYVPYTVYWFLSIISEILNKFVGIQPRITRYRLRSSQNAVVYSSDKIRKDLNWKPPYTLYDGFKNVINNMPEKLSN